MPRQGLRPSSCEATSAATVRSRTAIGIDWKGTLLDRPVTGRSRTGTGIDRTGTFLDRPVTSRSRTGTGIDRTGTLLDLPVTGRSRTGTVIDRTVTVIEWTGTFLDLPVTGRSRTGTVIDRTATVIEWTGTFLDLPVTGRSRTGTGIDRTVTVIDRTMTFIEWTMPVGAGRPGRLTLTPRIVGGPETTRTSDQRFRKPLLYPLSYGAKGRKPRGKWHILGRASRRAGLLGLRQRLLQPIHLLVLREGEPRVLVR